ncbi:GPI mannosyltransferas-like protein 1 [Eremomyces bilateralis CBS 781.70]|uniref:GPI mannosyltransferase 1 n=1 Tax=Eremomyces bilateralis CBS 781.70 TaxID=1392243 RepID=A0A6G1GI10_9PEZI|nr:GPI mannosyltransferas-like protein 1 [Eremomyces bilateralis CBS 781.70]KAF1817531.1 GPI mannosyltransferas-like protein 1 [Eremomyces bilateralis CBS 781.70]
MSFTTIIDAIFASPKAVFGSAIALRAVLLVYGLLQDAYSPVKYTDIDYFVFTDAARFVYQGRSPYLRDTYRYTPLLAWILIPTAWDGWFSFGKVLFALADLLAGYLMVVILSTTYRMPQARALKFASIWLLNPMVATISTRGSSEGLLGVVVTALLYAILQRNVVLAGLLLGFGVHFKIYPFIYTLPFLLWLRSPDGTRRKAKGGSKASLKDQLLRFLNRDCTTLAIFSFVSFMSCNVLMFYIYGFPFLKHSFLHHLTRIDHRHNFSPYNTLLHLNASPAKSTSFHLESLAFVPQILLSAVAIPFALTANDLASTMLAQTFAFVTFNKVCTSQYFLWYINFLPFYLPSSSLLKQTRLGVVAGILWILGQAIWLQQGFQLEFMGQSTFVPGLWMATLVFFFINIWILGIMIRDIGTQSNAQSSPDKKER